MDDLFGDASLFAEFEKDREAENSFIRYDESADRSKIIFEGFEESDNEESDVEWTDENEINANLVLVMATKDKDKDLKNEIDMESKKEDAADDTESKKEDAAEGEGSSKMDCEDTENKDGSPDEKKEENSDKNTTENDDVEKVDQSEIKEEVKNTPNQPDVLEKTKTVDESNTSTNNELKQDIPKSTNKSKKEKSRKKEDKMLDDDDTAWLYEHLYRNEKISKDSKQSMRQLIHERNKYHRYSKILDSTRCAPDEESPAIQLIFNNTAFARKYRQQIEQFIKGLLWQEYNSNNSENVTDIEVKSGAPTCVDINENLKPEQRNEAMRQNHAILGHGQFHKQFLIDSLGWPFTIAEPPRCNINWEIPLYGQVFDEVYADPSCKQIKPDAKKKQKPACWNCGHENCSVSQCRLPRNQARIQQNRKLFMEQSQQNKTQPKFTGASRYHLDPDIASKYNKFRPGTISDELREAMGLKSDQLPQYIYKMRLFGYPPGWLHEAKQVESGVSIYGKGGKATLTTGDQLEDGELAEAINSEKSEYDVNRIVEYPGFTIPTPLGIIDEHAVHKMPPIQQHQLKKTLVTQSEEKIAAKKRKLEKAAEERKKEEAKSKKARIEIKEDGEDDESSEKSEIKEETSEIKEETSEIKEETSEVQEGSSENMDVKESDQENAANGEVLDDSLVPDTPKDTKNSSTISLTKDFGTPILVRHKTALPDASKFAAGAEDHIPFENLPEATGTFEKMKNIIDLIRKKKS